MTNIVEAKSLTKQYHPDHPPAVNGVSYSIKPGEIFSLLGPNGAGKTTTIAMLSGLIQPTSGDAIIGGYSIIENPLEAKQKIGVIPQEVALYPTLTARQNLMFWGRMYGMGGVALKQRVAEVLAQIGLTDRADDKIDTYSGGMKRRVNIGAGLLHKPDILFMDEPTVGIDPQSRRAILDMTKDLNEGGMAVLYTTHYMEEAQELSQRIGIQDHGELIALGTLEELTKLVGQADTVTLQMEAMPDGVVERLNQLDGVTSTVAADQRLTLLVDEANHRLPSLINTITEVGGQLASIDIQQPNLEAVFLHLTGRALRD